MALPFEFPICHSVNFLLKAPTSKLILLKFGILLKVGYNALKWIFATVTKQCSLVAEIHSRAGQYINYRLRYTNCVTPRKKKFI